MAVTDDAVRERHGMRCRERGLQSDASVTIYEDEREVVIESHVGARCLTPWQARYLAAKLYRLSRRIRQRTEQAE